MREIPELNKIITTLIDKDQEVEEYLTEIAINSEIGQLIYDVRIEANLSQDELGKLIGVSGEIIDDLELGDYQGNALLMLKKIAQVLQKKIRLELVA